MLKFYSLHNHTGFSTYDGLGSVDDHAKWVLENAGENSGGFAISDHGNLSAAGYIAAAQEKYKESLKITWGVEAYYLPDLSEWKTLKNEADEKKKKEKKKGKKESESFVIENEEESKNNKYFDPLNRRNHLVVCAANQVGLSNLFTLLARSYREGFFKKPRIDINMLRDCNEGLIVSTACIGGVPAYASFYARENDLDVMTTYENELGPLMEIFGKDRFFLELQFNKIPKQQITNKDVIQFAKKTGFSLIAAADAHYCRPELWRDRELYKLLGWQMQKEDTSEKVQELREKTINDLDCQLYLKNGDQMFESYKEEFKNHHDDDQLIKEAIERTYHIAHDYIEDVSPDNSIKLPKTFQVTENIKTPFDQLKELVLQGLKGKGLHKQKKYVDRAIYELKVVKNLEVSEYFLTELAIVDEMKKHGLIGVGRGSSAGAIINYLLGINLVDPVRYGLIFERFMSPSRKELPDIDQDFEAKEHALEILSERFGEGNVVAISNYNRLQLKSLIKDISKLYEIPFQEVNQVMKVAESEARPAMLEEIGGDQKLYDFSFDGAKKHSPTFAKFIKKYPEVGDHIQNLYQAQKSISKHAGGVCVLPEIEKHIPILKIRGTEQSAVSEGLTVQHLQRYFGIPKFDVLGVTALKIVRRCIEIVLIDQGVEDPSIDDVWMFYNKFLNPDIIDDADPKVFEKVYHKGQFPSIFQFSEKPMQKFCKSALPNNVDDISAINAIWRPGPLSGQADLRYLGAADEKNRRAFKKEHPIIQKILGSTRGILIYQEHFQFLAHELAGFSLEDANTLRKILVKPATSLGEELKKKRIDAGEKFISGCIDKGLSEERAKKLWEEEILGFISYGFNHCVSGNTKFYSPTISNGRHYTIEELYKIKNDINFAKENKSIPTRNKILKNGYGCCWSLSEKDRLVKNRIKDIRYEGLKLVYRLTTESGVFIDATHNHKFPTFRGKKQLKNIVTGSDSVYINQEWEQYDTGYRFNTEVNNLPTKGQRGFQKRETSYATKLEKVVSIECIGKEEVYDVEVEGPYHTFTTDSGIVTSNSHSLSYAMNSYHCAWLYTYHEKAWIKACLERDPDPQKTISVVRQLGYNVLKPDVNLSKMDEWSVVDKDCAPPLISLDGMGVVGAAELIRNRPEGGFKNIQEFLFDGETYRYSKFNKKCLTALIRTEGFNQLNCVGYGKLFKNYAHMENTLYGTTTKLKTKKDGTSLGKYITYKNLDLLKKHKNTLEELAMEADSDDWPVVQKIEFQKEIMGFYDKSLIVGEFLPVFSEFDIDAIDDTEDEEPKRNVWGIVETSKQKTSTNGKPYVQVEVSGMTEKKYMFRVWATEKKNSNWQEGNILSFSLDFSEQWGYSIPYRSKVIKIEK